MSQEDFAELNPAPTRADASHAASTWRGPKGLEALAGEWRRLEVAAEAAPLPLALARARAGGRDSRLIAVRKGGRLVGVWGFEVLRFGPIGCAVRLGGALQASDGPTVANGADGAAVVRAAWEELRRWSDTHAVDLAVLEQGCAALTLPAVAAVAAPCSPALRLEVGAWSGPPEALPSLSSSRRKSLRRHRRRLADQGALRLVRERSAEGRARTTREAIALKRAWLADRGLRNPALASDWLADTLTAALTDPDGAAPYEVFRLTVDGRTAAIEVGLIDGLTYRSYLGAYAPEFADHGPGKLLTADVARWCRAQGLAAYDLLPPVTDFKRSWCDGRREMSRAVVPLRHRARLVLPLIRSGRGRLKQAYHALSEPQRAWLNAAADRLAARLDR